MKYFSSLFSKAYTVTLSVTSDSGFHLRPIAQFSSIAKQYSCKTIAHFQEKKAEAKDVSSLLSLSLEKGDSFTLSCKGKDAEEAIKKLEQTFNDLMKNDKREKREKRESMPYKGIPIKGKIVSNGISIGKIHHHHETKIETKIETKVETNTKNKMDFQDAFDQAAQELNALHLSDSKETNIYLAQKELLLSLQKYRSSYETFKEAIEKLSESLQGGMHASKITDYKDILQRVENHLGMGVDIHYPTHPFILVADDLLPSQIENLSSVNTQGVILQKSSLYAHSAILLRAIGIPSLLIGHSELNNETEVILDANAGVLLSSPTQEDLKIAQERLKQHQKNEAEADKLKHISASTTSGKQITVLSNITDEESAKSAKAEGAEGVGLFRTEFLFTDKKPSFDLQVATYKKVFSYFDTVTIRTLDVGGDKNLSYVDIPHEKNPFLGIRGVRLFKTHPEILEEQIHAILIASHGRPIKIMFPMVSDAEEFVYAKDFCLNVAKKQQLNTDNVEFGIMIEVPSVLFSIGQLNHLVDFYSIGTNDLAQYLFAVDRTHESLEIDLLSPVLFQVIENIVKESHKPLSICGELAAHTEAIPKLLALGIDTLSVSPKRIAQTKKEIRNV